MPKGATVTARYYSDIYNFEKLKEKLKNLRQRIAQKNVLHLHDNAPSLAHFDFYLFPQPKKGSLETNMRPGWL